MKKILLFIILITIFLPENSYAAEYKLDKNGNYSVKEAFCTYEYTVNGFLGTSSYYKFKIKFKNEKIVDIESLGDVGFGEYNEFVHLDTLKYSNFFVNKQFSCPSTVDVNFLAAPSNGLSQGYYLETACDEETLGLQCNRATIIKEETGILYNTKDENEQDEIVEKNLICAYQKITSSVGSAAQSKAPNLMDYIKYSNNKQEFVDRNNNVYNIPTGSLNKCTDNISIELVIKNQNISEMKIVDTCNESTDNKCVKYRLSSIANNTDSTLQEDGSSEQAPDLIDPNEIPTISAEVDVPMDFDTSKGCESYLGNPEKKGQPAYYLHFIFNLMKYVAIVMLFVFTIVEFAKAIVASDQDTLKKALKKSVKRLIIAIIIFFLPILIEFLFEILGLYSASSCGI